MRTYEIRTKEGYFIGDNKMTPEQARKAEKDFIIKEAQPKRSKIGASTSGRSPGADDGIPENKRRHAYQAQPPPIKKQKGKGIIAQFPKWYKIMRKDFFENLKAEKTTYREMIDFCCDNLVMNNYIIQELSAKGFYFDIENGTDYDEEEDCYYDVYQYFIIDSGDAERLKEYTNELVYYCEDLDLYILGVCHFGTPWNGAPANWKDEIEE